MNNLTVIPLTAYIKDKGTRASLISSECLDPFNYLR